MSNLAELKDLPKERKKYVVGFLIDPTLSKVVLVRKNRPDYQRGLLNGVGGKVGDTILDETTEEAMAREFQEETGGVDLNWRRFLHMMTPRSDLTFFYAIGNVHCVRTQTDEEVAVYDISDVMDRCDTMPNVRWCIQMARSIEFGEHADYFEVAEILETDLPANFHFIPDAALEKEDL
jgi:8-oxo-dGTP diphosphatase